MLAYLLIQNLEKVEKAMESNFTRWRALEAAPNFRYNCNKITRDGKVSIVLLF